MQSPFIIRWNIVFLKTVSWVAIFSLSTSTLTYSSSKLRGNIQLHGNHSAEIEVGQVRFNSQTKHKPSFQLNHAEKIAGIILIGFLLLVPILSSVCEYKTDLGPQFNSDFFGQNEKFSKLTCNGPEIVELLSVTEQAIDFENFAKKVEKVTEESSPLVPFQNMQSSQGSTQLDRRFQLSEVFQSRYPELIQNGQSAFQSIMQKCIIPFRPTSIIETKSAFPGHNQTGVKHRSIYYESEIWRAITTIVGGFYDLKELKSFFGNLGWDLTGEANAILDILKEFKNEMNLSDHAALDLVRCAVNQIVTYDGTVSVARSPHYYSVSQGQLEKVVSTRKAICGGFSMLTKRIARHLGLEVVAQVGYGHVFNAVKLNGSWYKFEPQYLVDYIKENQRDRSLDVLTAQALLFDGALAGAVFLALAGVMKLVGARVGKYPGGSSDWMGKEIEKVLQEIKSR